MSCSVEYRCPHHWFTQVRCFGGHSVPAAAVIQDADLLQRGLQRRTRVGTGVDVGTAVPTMLIRFLRSRKHLPYAFLAPSWQVCLHRCIVCQDSEKTHGSPAKTFPPFGSTALCGAEAALAATRGGRSCSSSGGESSSSLSNSTYNTTTLGGGGGGGQQTGCGVAGGSPCSTIVAALGTPSASPPSNDSAHIPQPSRPSPFALRRGSDPEGLGLGGKGSGGAGATRPSTIALSSAAPRVAAADVMVLPLVGASSSLSGGGRMRRGSSGVEIPSGASTMAAAPSNAHPPGGEGGLARTSVFSDGGVDIGRASFGLHSSSALTAVTSSSSVPGGGGGGGIHRSLLKASSSASQALPPPPPGWTSIEGEEFISVMAVVTPCRSDKSLKGE